MSYGVIRMEKFKATAIRGIQIHNEREKDSRSNPDINKELSHKNFHLKKSENYMNNIKKNIADLNLKKSIRKDAVLMCGFVITSDKEFFKKISEDKQKDFFKKSYDFIAGTYGEKNIINAVVHMDEKTPHMHIEITPIKDGRLSAKNIFTRQALIQLQTDFFEHVGKDFGLQRGESREEKRKHLSTEEFKIKTRKENIEKNLKELSENNYKINEEDFEKKKNFIGINKEKTRDVALRIINKYLNPLYLENKELKNEIDILKKNNKEKDIFIEKYRYLKNIFVSGVKQEQFNALKIQAKKYKIKNKEKELQAQEEAKRQVQLEQEKKDRQKIYEAEKTRVSQLIYNILKNTFGTVGEHTQQRKELLEKWEKSNNKQEFERIIKEKLTPKEKSRNTYTR